MMRVSEAIRLGSLLVPQGFGFAYSRRVQGAVCANQAAKLAVGANESEEPWPWREEMVERCPFCVERFRAGCGFSPDVLGLVAHLNDDHRWSRERIADYVESLERERGMWPAESHELPAADVALALGER